MLQSNVSGINACQINELTENINEMMFLNQILNSVNFLIILIVSKYFGHKS